ncbi:hypothetical protein AKN87_04580 [Thiopseudomonas alkaliphila]|nr:hypothetical protein AKN87_04580 [Thiopseudomonas alkaliphila]
MLTACGAEHFDCNSDYVKELILKSESSKNLRQILKSPGLLHSGKYSSLEEIYKKSLKIKSKIERVSVVEENEYMKKCKANITLQYKDNVKSYPFTYKIEKVLDKAEPNVYVSRINYG